MQSLTCTSTVPVLRRGFTSSSERATTLPATTMAFSGVATSPTAKCAPPCSTTHWVKAESVAQVGEQQGVAVAFAAHPARQADLGADMFRAPCVWVL